MQKILFLASWYPVRFDAMIGLFVKRHAEVVAQTHEVAVLHVTADYSNHRMIETEVFKVNGVFTVIVYYKRNKGKLPVFSQLIKAIRWLYAFLTGIRIVFRQFGRPQYLHIHVLMLRIGIMTFVLSRLLSIPYYITEHSSYFLPEKNVRRNRWWTIATRWLARKSNGLSAVSERLKHAMQDRGYTHPHFRVIRNVVPDVFFQIDPRYRSKDRIIFSNITCFDDSVKNISGLVRTVARMRNYRQDFELRLIGTGPDKPAIEKLVADLKLDDCVHFTGMLFDDQLVQEIVGSDFTVLFSNYETMAVVIAESMACGRPVVATRTGGIPELVNSSNGLLVEPGNEDDLLRQLLRMMDTYRQYDPDKLRLEAMRLFSKQSVSEAFDRFYFPNLS